jgi:hypothetical protein
MFHFFEQENLEKIYQWFGANKRKNWESKGSSLILHNSNGRVVEIANVNSENILPWLAAVSVRDAITF